MLLQRAPAGSWVISTKINMSELTNEGEQAGLILWQSERSGNPITGQNNFAKIVYINKGITRRFEYVSTRNNGQDIQNSPEFTENPTEVYMRVSSNGTNRIIAEGSFDGETWTQIANPITPSNSTAPMHFGLKVSDTAASTNRAMFDYFRVDCSDRVPPQTTATTDPGAPNGKLGWYKSAPTVTLKADEARDHEVPGRRRCVAGVRPAVHGRPARATTRSSTSRSTRPRSPTPRPSRR